MADFARIPDEVTDQRLLPLLEGLKAGRIRVLSLDVFDTLLWRRVPEPADVFDLLGHKLAEDGKLARTISPLGFADLRRAAEKAAREKAQAITGYREVTLADIYAALSDHIFATGFDAAARVTAELDFERALMVLDGELVTLMRAAKAAGAKVILVSDTYFTAAQVRGFLTAAGLTDHSLIDRLYVSCEAGKPKYRDLFDDIIRDLGVMPAAIAHVGDSFEADIAPCRARGIVVASYDKWAFSPRVQTVEFPAGTKARARRNVLLNQTGDFGFTGLRARLAHRAPSSLPQDLKPYWAYGAAILAPVFTAFARWVVQECKATGTTKIFGLMREGRFLRRLVEATAQQIGVPLKVEELWLSRRAVVRAGLYADDLSLLTEALLLTPGGSPDEILSAWGLTRDDLKTIAPAFKSPEPDLLATLSQAIGTTPALRDKVLAMSARLRVNLLKGVGKALTKPKSVLLDLGYAATIQAVLARILAREKTGIAMGGLYLALNEKAMAHVRGGVDLAAFLSDDGFLGLAGELLSRTPDVLEHACMCREGSLAAYDDAGAPVLLLNQRGETQLRQMEALQDGIMAGTAAINALLGDLARTPGNAGTLKAQAAQILAAALLHPTPEEAATIGAWQHEANFDLNDRRRLADLSFNPVELEFQGWPALQELGRHQVYWPAAALVSANPFLGAGFAAGQREAYGAEYLTAGPLLGYAVLAPDLGAGFDIKRQGAMPLAVHALGRGEMKVVVKPFGPEGYLRLRMTWPKVRAIVAIDSIAGVYLGEQETRIAKVTSMAWEGAEEVSAGTRLTLASETASAVLTLDAAPPWPHALELTLRYKYLRLDSLFGAR